MDCFTSPTRKRLVPFRDRAVKMAFCTSLVSWYSSTMISSYRADHWRASSVGAPSSPTSRRTAMCSRSAKSTMPRRAFSAA
ncbi:Uncharacterised protein [Flavonifractor plautii]|uniref:Uncharacterized protein n=1 Tax=Flavonifractor plautii TaxID=292800 RepID=A0A174TTQ5_FLAPL|nr:Uncharacterised protein [Flavonifractor plautii]